MRNLCELVALSVEYLDKAVEDPLQTKQDVVDGMRQRLCVILGMLVSYPANSSFALPLGEPPEAPAMDDTEVVRASFGI